jgi:hypothetical protein
MAISSGLMLTNFRTTSCPSNSMLVVQMRNCYLLVDFLVWQLAPLVLVGSRFAEVGVHYNGSQVIGGPQVPLPRCTVVDTRIRVARYVVHRQGMLPVEASGTVVSHCANSGPVGGEGQQTLLVIVHHLAEGRT